MGSNWGYVMKRAAIVLLLCILAGAWAACAVHGNVLPGDGSATAASDGTGCGHPVVAVALTILPLLPSTGVLASDTKPSRPIWRPVPTFQPPEPSA